MPRTGVLVARHGPLLANAAFLPPGAPACLQGLGFRASHMPRTGVLVARHGALLANAALLPPGASRLSSRVRVQVSCVPRPDVSIVERCASAARPVIRCHDLPGWMA